MASLSLRQNSSEEFVPPLLLACVKLAYVLREILFEESIASSVFRTEGMIQTRLTVSAAGRSCGGPSEKFARVLGGICRVTPFWEVACTWKSPEATNSGAIF